MNNVVLFVNSREKACGVHQFFYRLTKPMMTSIKYQCYYIDPDQEWEFNHWVTQLNPTIIVYNFYFSGQQMPWLTSDIIRRNRESGRKQLCIHHEGSVLDKGFDMILHQDPFNTDPQYFNLSRPIPEYHNTHCTNDKVTIGSFGFGLGGKGFGRLVETVCNEFDTAHIKLSIPFAHFGDPTGTGATWWANHARSLLTKPGITLNITHNLMPENELLDFLASNDMNCFLYDGNGGRGISGTTDYALAVYRPIAITMSDQFKHLWKQDDSFVVEKHSLREILQRGNTPLDKFRAMWSTDKLVDSFEQAFNLILGKESIWL